MSTRRMGYRVFQDPDRPQTVTYAEDLIIRELKRLSKVALRDLLSDPEKTLALLNGWSPSACQEIIQVYSDTLAPLATTRLVNALPEGFIGFTTHGDWVVEVQHVIALVIQRDTLPYYIDPALVNGWKRFPFWLPATNQWIFNLTNTDGVFTSRNHGAFQGFHLRSEIWTRLRPLIEDYGQQLSLGRVEID